MLPLSLPVEMKRVEGEENTCRDKMERCSGKRQYEGFVCIPLEEMKSFYRYSQCCQQLQQSELLRVFGVRGVAACLTGHVESVLGWKSFIISHFMSISFITVKCVLRWKIIVLQKYTINHLYAVLAFKTEAQEPFVSIGFMHEVIHNAICDSKVFLLNLSDVIVSILIM